MASTTRRARLAVTPLEARTVPTAGIVEVSFAQGLLSLEDDVGGTVDDVTVTEVGPKQFQVTGNNGTRLVDHNGQLLSNPVTGTLTTPQVDILGVFGFDNGTVGPSDDHLTINGTGQTTLSSVQLQMWGGSDSVSITGIQAGSAEVNFGAGDSRFPDNGDDTLQIDSSFIGSLNVDSANGLGTANLNMSLTHFLGGEPAKPAPGWGVNVKAGGGTGDTINLSSLAVFGSVNVTDSSQAAITVDGSGGTADQGLITNGLTVEAGAIQPSQITVANLTVGSATVGWGYSETQQTSPSTIAISNLDSSGPLTVDTQFDRRNLANVFTDPTTLTVSNSSAPKFTFMPNNQPDTVSLSGCGFTGLTLVGGAAADAFTIDGCSVAKAATIDAAGGTNTVQVTNSSFGDVQMGAGTGDDSFTVSGDSFTGLEFNGGGGTNIFNLTGSSVAGKLNLLGGPDDDYFTLDGITAGSLNYTAGLGYNPFTLKGHSHIFGNAILTGAAGTDRIEIEQTDFGSTAAGKAAGGNLKIKTAGGTNDQVLLGYTVTTTNDSDANHVQGGLTITGTQGEVQLGFTKVRGATLISMTDPHGDDELDVNADTFYGRFTYSSHNAGTFAEIGEHADGAATTFYGGLDLSGITGQSVINLATVSPGGDHSGPVSVYGTFLYKLALNVGANFHVYKF